MVGPETNDNVIKRKIEYNEIEQKKTQYIKETQYKKIAVKRTKKP